MAKSKIMASDREGKKYKVVVNGKEIHFGASGYRIKPGDPSTPNYWARQLWSCRGDKSISDKPFFGKSMLP